MSSEQGPGRVAEYRKTARQMTMAAKTATDPAIASALVALAAQWERLADEVERSAAFVPHDKRPGAFSGAFPVAGEERSFGPPRK
jgi:hypothetical protein